VLVGSTRVQPECGQVAKDVDIALWDAWPDVRGGVRCVVMEYLQTLKTFARVCFALLGVNVL